MTGTTGRRGRLGCVTIRCMAVLVIGFLWCGVGFCSVESASAVSAFPGGVVSPPVSDSNGASSAPVNVDPVDMETEVGVPVELVGSAFDPTSAGLTHVASQWQLRYAMSAADFSDTLYDSGSSAQDLTSIEIGAPFLDFGTSYIWRVRYADDSGSWTDWSQQTTFQTELQRYAGYETFSFDGEVQDVLLDETRNRFWALRKDLSRVEAYDLQTLEQIASVATGMEPESFAMTWDKRYLGVGSRANTYLTVVDLESDLSGRLGLFSSLDGLKVFRVASLNTGDLIFVTRPDTYGSPPFGGHVHLWHGDTHAVEVLSFYDGANNTIFGLGAADKYLLAKWGFSQGGIQLWNVSRAPFNAVVQDEHFASLFIGADTFVGADPVHGQFIIDNDLVDINGTDLDFRTEIPAVYNGTEPVFNPADGDEVVMSASLSKTLAVWHLSDLQPHLTINLPNGLGWAGRGQFSDDGQQILLLLKDGSNSVVSYHYVPLVNPFTITTPTQSAVDVPVQPLVAISGTYDLGAQHALSHWQMRELFSPADYSERVFDTVTSGSARHAVRVDTVTLSGQTEYALRMRYRNTSGTWSAWCEESHFATVYVPPTETPTPTLTPTPTITPTVTPTPDASATPTATPIPMVPENQAVHITSDGHFYAIGYGYESGRLVGWVDAFTQATMSFDLLASEWVGLFVYDYGEGSVSEALYIWYSPLPRSRAQGCMSGSFSAYSSTSVE